MRKAVAVACAMALAACSFPSRDNANDPSVRPRPVLVVADWTPVGGTCATAATPLPGDLAVPIAPIGHCLVLDARQSTNAALLTSSLIFTFSGSHLDAPVTNTTG